MSSPRRFVVMNCQTLKKTFLRVIYIFAFFIFFQTTVTAQVAPLSGGEIFIETGCTRCHTIGKGRFVGPDLLGVGEKYSREELINWARNPELIYAKKGKKPVNDGYPPMPPANLSKESAEKVADYLLNYSPPVDSSNTGEITGIVTNVTASTPQQGSQLILISYMGDREKERRFAETNSDGRFSFSGLRWDRSYEITLFHQGVQYVSGKMVFSPSEEEIEVSLPVYDTSDSDESVSVSELSIIVYPDDENNYLNITSLYVFENRGNTVFTGKQSDSDTITTLSFPIPKDAENIGFSDVLGPEDTIKKEGRFYSKSPLLPGIKKVVMGYSIPMPEAKGKVPLSFDYDIAVFSLFIRKTDVEIKAEIPSAVPQDIEIHGDSFLKYEKSFVKRGTVELKISESSFLKNSMSRYLPVIAFFLLVLTAIAYFLHRKKIYWG